MGWTSYYGPGGAAGRFTCLGDIVMSRLLRAHPLVKWGEANDDVEYTLICTNDTRSGQMESYQQQRRRVPKALRETRQDQLTI